ncbi:nucleotide sugar dehydrogenase [archaeon]|nr:nucleotide sugar dehydrogenase [archaeon]
MLPTGSPATIARFLRSGKCPVCVMGLGRMGLPMSVLLAEAGVRVIGFDIDERAVRAVNSRRPHIAEKGLQERLRKLSPRLLRATTDPDEAIKESCVVTVVVPTLVRENGSPDYSYVVSAASTIGRYLRREALVVLQSTVGIGVTRKIFARTIEKESGLTAGKDFLLAYSPIRAAAGSILRDLQRYSKVVGGINERSTDAAEGFLRTFVKGEIVRVSSIEAAEAAKLFELIYRDVNIALAQQLATVCERYGLSYFEVCSAANSQPYCHLHLPSVGVGGHCVPIVPYFLIRNPPRGATISLIEEARRFNKDVPKRIARRITRMIRTLKPRKPRIAFLGLTFKPNAKDVSFSRAIEIAKYLSGRGYAIRTYDPLLKPKEIEALGLRAAPNFEACLENANLVVIAVSHKAFRDRLSLDLITSYTDKRILGIFDGGGVLSLEAVRQLADRWPKRGRFLYTGVGVPTIRGGSL